MPSIREMFPRRYLSHEDFKPGEIVYVTIRSVVMIAARASGGSPSSGLNRPMANVEPEWAIQFDEFNKPMRLKISKANAIAALLRTDRTEDWTGHRIGIYRGMYDIGGTLVEGLKIDDRPAPATTHEIVRNAGAGTPLINRELIRATLPTPALKRFMDNAKAKGKTWNDFLGWSKNAAPEAHELINGVALEDVSAAVMPAMKVYLDELNAPPAKRVEAGSAQHTAPEVSEDDIPF